MKFTEAQVTTDATWPGHNAGQVAFVTFDPKAGKHPFTLASSWDSGTRSNTFISKGIGDYTERLPRSLAIPT